MAGVDILVSTSLSEGYHLAVQEAMALGVPVIATAEGFLADLPSSQRAIFEIPKRDAHAVSEAIRRLAGDVSLRADLSSRGRAWGAAQSWEEIARRIMSTLVAVRSAP
jgi:phosphatidylinositol alpha 1,6-mannosyltransferase